MSLMNDFIKENPKVIASFMEYTEKASCTGHLSNKIKELIALAISIATHCDPCIAYHTKKALEAGVKSEELIEVINVCIVMGGGPSMMYGIQAYAAMKQFEGDDDEFPDWMNS